MGRYNYRDTNVHMTEKDKNTGKERRILKEQGERTQRIGAKRTLASNKIKIMYEDEKAFRLSSIEINNDR